MARSYGRRLRLADRAVSPSHEYGSSERQRMKKPISASAGVLY